MNIDTQDNEQLLTFFQALSDASRLRIVGLLAQREYTVEQLAEALDLRPSTVSHHLSRLARAGLVSARAESYYNYYRLEEGALKATARGMLSQEFLQAIQTTGVAEAEARPPKIVRDYLRPDGRLKTIPAQRKKLEAILRYIVQSFEPGRHYSEKEVNQMLRGFHEDTASLRRELVGYRLMERARGEYWRTTADRPVTEANHERDE